MIKRPRRWLFPILVLVLSICLIVGGLFVVSRLNRVVTEDVQSLINEIATQSVVRLNSTISAEIASLQLQAAFISRYGDIQDPEIISILRLESEAGGFIRLGVITPDGWSVNSDDYEVNLAFREYFQQAIQGRPVVSQVLQHTQDEQQRIIVVAVPIYRSGQVIGILRGVRDIHTYANMLQVTTPNGKANAYIVKPTGEVVLANTGFSDGIYSHELSFTELPSFQSTAGLQELAAAVGRGESGMVQVRGQNLAEYVDYRPLGINDWYVLTVLPEQALMGTLSSVARVLAVGLYSALSLLIIALLVYGFLRERRHEVLEHIAFTDKVTELWSWDHLRYETRNKIGELGKQGYSYVLVDIDRFKLINGAVGYETGTAILRAMGAVIAGNIGPDEFAARVVNDRFALIIRSDFSIEKRVSELIRSLDTLRSSTVLEAHRELSLTFSCGICPLEREELELEVVHDRAQIALETVKTSGLSAFAFYDESLHERMQRQRKLEGRFSKALEEHEFAVHYQPKFDIDTLEIVGAEALVRWNHPTFGTIPPGEFIPFLEENGRIGELDRYVFRQACSHMKVWYEQGYPQIPISVNVSRIHVLAPNFVEAYQAILDEFSLPKKSVEIELTESAFTQDTQQVMITVAKLRTLGFSVALDDFGSGFSSLNLLKDLHVDTLKIDRLFLQDFDSNTRAEVVVRVVLTLARDLSMSVVAEGVESEKQLAFLRKVNCQSAQGFLLAKPMDVDAFLSLWKPWSVNR